MSSLDPQRLEDLPREISTNRLSFIRPGKRRLDAGHSFAVKVLRKALPACAALVLIALILWPILSSDKMAAVVMKNIPDLVVDHLNFDGLDSKNQPYVLKAEKATRPSNLHSIYDLDKPSGDILLTNGTWVAGKALYGRYNPDTHRMWVGGDVQLFQDKGTQFTTDEAQIDLSDNNAWGEGPVLIQGDFGTIRGIGFRMLDSGKIMIITGPAHASLDLQHDTSSDKPTTVAK